MKKKPSLRNWKLKANRASETEELRRERLRIRREKDRITKKIQENKRRSSETEDHKIQHLATLKRLKRGDENELERNLNWRSWSLINTSGWPWREEERRARLENDAAT